ncbi:MAG TPA: DUF423 domain-containing protein [Roseiarcus sp.]|nr:DUF423 domain-containing protein [Roseiarcus sp.]
MTRLSYALSAFAALMGASGVALAAAAAHRGGGDLAQASALFLIMHAAALLGLSALAAQAARAGFRRALLISGFGLGLAACLFSADLAARGLAGGRLFPFAAPIGGTGMIVFWLVIAGLSICAALRRT